MIGPSGWTRTTTSRGKGPACCVHTTKGVERMAGFEPAPQGLEGPQATVTPHSLGSGPGQRPRPNTDRCRSPALRHPSVVKDPALASCSYARVGDSARIRTWTREFWRLGCFRYTTLPAPSLSTASTTQPPSDLARALSRARGQQKRPSRGSPQKACFSMTAGPLGRFGLRIRAAAVVALDPELCHGSAHTGGD